MHQVGSAALAKLQSTDMPFSLLEKTSTPFYSIYSATILLEAASTFVITFSLSKCVAIDSAAHVPTGFT